MRKLAGWIAGGLVVMVAGGCSVKRMAVNQLGDALAASGSVYASDDDPELVREAAPFSLKLMESLLAESPEHEGLLLAAASGFAQYAYAFVQQDAERMEARDFRGAEELRVRARRLYLRAKRYGLRALEVAHPGFGTMLGEDALRAVEVMEREDVAALYWTAAAWGGAISISKDDPALIAEQPQVEALLDRALELDEGFGEGAIHGLLISYEMARQGGEGDPAGRSRVHFERAMELSRGQQAAPLVGFAESVMVQKQDRKQFEVLLERALAVDVDADPDSRLINLVMQRRARWLLTQVDELFLTSGEDE